MKNGVVCGVCELLIKKLDNKLKGKKTKEEVEEALDTLCDDIPWSDQCKHLVKTYSDTIVKMIVDDLKDAHQICQSIGLCMSNQGEHSISGFKSL